MVISLRTVGAPSLYVGPSFGERVSADVESPQPPALHAHTPHLYVMLPGRSAPDRPRGSEDKLYKAVLDFCVHGIEQFQVTEARPSGAVPKARGECPSPLQLSPTSAGTPSFSDFAQTHPLLHFLSSSLRDSPKRSTSNRKAYLWRAAHVSCTLLLLIQLALMHLLQPV